MIYNIINDTYSRLKRFLNLGGQYTLQDNLRRDHIIVCFIFYLFVITFSPCIACLSKPWQVITAFFIEMILLRLGLSLFESEIGTFLSYMFLIFTPFSAMIWLLPEEESEEKK